MNKILNSLIIICMIFTFCACSPNKNESDLIVGKWECSARDKSVFAILFVPCMIEAQEEIDKGNKTAKDYNFTKKESPYKTIEMNISKNDLLEIKYGGYKITGKYDLFNNHFLMDVVMGVKKIPFINDVTYKLKGDSLTFTWISNDNDRDRYDLSFKRVTD